MVGGTLTMSRLRLTKKIFSSQVICWIQTSGRGAPAQRLPLVEAEVKIIVSKIAEIEDVVIQQPFTLRLVKCLRSEVEFQVNGWRATFKHCPSLKNDRWVSRRINV
jgi:hypothetical protein